MRLSLLPVIGVVATSMLVACSVGHTGELTGSAEQAIGDKAIGNIDSNCHVFARDFFVSHVSTVAANAGQTVNLFVREKACGGNTQSKHKRPTVLFLQGRSEFATPAFDFQFGTDYSWADHLAKRGFDVYIMDLQGYGGSTIPSVMNNPCNTSTANQTSFLIPNPLAATCPAANPQSFGNLLTDWAEIDTVVDHIRASQDDPSAKVSLIGHSRGGLRAIGYAVLHPDKVERLVAFAPGRYPPSNANPPFPLNVGNQASFFADQNAQQHCPDQTEAGVQDALWAQNMAFETLGATWGPPSGTGIRRFPSFAIGVGWQADMPNRLTVPTLVVRGEFDTNAPEPTVQALYNLIPASKVYVTVKCAGHELHTESRHTVLFDASAQWLASGSVDGCENGCTLTK